MQTRIFYPQTSSERYPRDVEETTELFGQLLFQPRRLGAVVHPDFREYLEGEDEPALVGLQALQEYRYQFGEPKLHRATFFAVPPHLARLRLNGGGRFTFDGLMELDFRIPYDSLAPEWREGFNEDDDAFRIGGGVPVVLRMWEPNYSRPLTADEALPLGIPAGTRMIMERSYWPYLVNGLGRPHEQIAHVAEQVRYFAQTRRPMWTAPNWTHSWVAYNTLMDDKFASNPLGSY